MLSLLSWYLPEEIRLIFQFSLEEHWSKCNADAVERKILLNSKAYALAFVHQIEDWNENDFYGNYLSKGNVKRLFLLFGFKRNSVRKISRYSGYCRGYRDSRRESSNKVPHHLRVGVISEEELVLQKLAFDFEVFRLSEKIERFLKAQL